MRTLRVSATDVDAFRYYKSQEEASLEDLLAQLRHQDEKTPAMEAGKAFHKALETIGPLQVSKLECDGYTFNMNCEAEIELMPYRELKATVDITIDDVIVTLVGKVDGINGKAIIDHKLTGKWESENYTDKYQWRIYLEVFDANEFTLNIFVGKAKSKEPKTYNINDFHSLTLHRYPDLSEDVCAELEKFVAFADKHMPERFGVA